MYVQPITMAGTVTAKGRGRGAIRCLTTIAGLVTFQTWARREKFDAQPWPRSQKQPLRRIAAS